MIIKYPIFGQDRDKWMYMIDSGERLNSDLETIDIENKEYVGWDSDGKPIEFYLDEDEIKIRCKSSEPKLEELKSAILDYAKIAKPKKVFVYSREYKNISDFFRTIENHINSR